MKFLMTLMLLISSVASAEVTLKAFGPGGPAPAMKKCAAAFEKFRNIKMIVTSGPTNTWLAEAPTADLFYSGSENMMDDFASKIPQLDVKTIQTHYLRPSAILVRPKNPKKINGVKDLTSRDLKVIVVNGAGQVGMWEDIIGRMKSVNALNQFRANIVYAAKNTGEAERKWKEDSSIDAWVVFNIWGTRNHGHAEIIPTEANLTIYRSMGTALSKETKHAALVNEFVTYIKSTACNKMFTDEGWFN